MSKRAPKQPHKHNPEWPCECDACLAWADLRIAAKPNNPPAYAWAFRKGACVPALNWIVDNKIRTMNQAWWECPRVDWLEWILETIDTDESYEILEEVDRQLAEMWEQPLAKKVSAFREIVHPRGCPKPPKSARRKK